MGISTTFRFKQIITISQPILYGILYLWFVLVYVEPQQHTAMYPSYPAIPIVTLHSGSQLQSTPGASRLLVLRFSVLVYGCLQESNPLIVLRD